MMSRRNLLRIVASILCLILVFSCTLALAGSKPKIKKQPQNQAVSAGGSCKFTISQSGATGITWRIVNPDTEETILCSKASKRFKGLKVSGQNSNTLKLSKIPAELDGWQVYCTLKNSNGAAETDHVWIFVGKDAKEKLASAQSSSQNKVSSASETTGANDVTISFEEESSSDKDANIDDGYVYTGNIGGSLKKTDYAKNTAKSSKKYKITCEGCSFVDNTKMTESATSGSVKGGNLVTFHAESQNGGDQYYWSYNNKTTKSSAYAVTVSENIDMTCVPMYKMKYSGCSGDEYAMHGYVLTVKPDFDGDCKVEVYKNKTLLETFDVNGPFEYNVTQKIKFVCTQK